MGEEGVYDGGDREKYGEEGEEKELDEEKLKYFQMNQNKNKINNKMNNQMQNKNSPFNYNDLEEFEY